MLGGWWIRLGSSYMIEESSNLNKHVVTTMYGGEQLAKIITIKQDGDLLVLLAPRGLSGGHLNYSASNTPYISSARVFSYNISKTSIIKNIRPIDWTI